MLPLYPSLPDCQSACPPLRPVLSIADSVSGYFLFFSSAIEIQKRGRKIRLPHEDPRAGSREQAKSQRLARGVIGDQGLWWSR